MEKQMVLQKEIIFMRFYFMFVLMLVSANRSHAEKGFSNSSLKSVIIQEIMKKVSNITLNSLSKVPAEKKETILSKIENKLRKSAQSMGPDANKYVKFIMQEFKTKAFDKAKRNVSQVIQKSINLRNEGKASSHSAIDAETKHELIKDIADKIQSLAKGFMKNAKTIDNKKDILVEIKRRIMDSTKQKHIQLHNKHEELKAYSSLIAQGLEVSMQKLISDERDTRRMESNTELKPLTGEERETDDIMINKDIKMEEDLMKKSMIVIDIEEINKFKNLILESLNDTSTDPHCDEIVEDLCYKIQSFNKISCGAGKTVSIENLCNDVVDCWNQVDEVNCTSQAMEKIRKATAVMSEVEASLNRKCLASSVNGDILTAQNHVLRNVLQTQMDFLHKRVPLRATQNNDKVPDGNSLKRTVWDVSMILSTLSYALDGTICANHIETDRISNNVLRKYNDIETDVLDDMPRDPSWPTKSCTCKGQFCEGKICDSICKRVCWQKYSLNHWGCQAINGGTSVTLHVLCDGKLDCFDETDETNCSTDANYSKFEAGSLYINLLDYLATKSKSHEFVTTRNKLVAMHALVSQLQKHTMKTNTDKHTIKSLRDESFKLLHSIYDDLLQTAGPQELNDRYLILLTINEKLVTALKRSHTGNENLMSAEGCYCRGGLCALRRCTKHCIKVCLAEPVLTRFSCNTQNISVPIELICNGRNNCPNGEDEKGCNKKDICRGHHLVVLRHNLQDVEVKHRGTVLGEVIDTWKTKVSATLLIAESTERPNHNIMIDIMSRVLKDLVLAFTAIEDYRRTNSDSTLQEFVAISKIVMDTLKSCNN